MDKTLVLDRSLGPFCAYRPLEGGQLTIAAKRRGLTPLDRRLHCQELDDSDYIFQTIDTYDIDR